MNSSQIRSCQLYLIYSIISPILHTGLGIPAFKGLLSLFLFALVVVQCWQTNTFKRAFKSAGISMWLLLAAYHFINWKYIGLFYDEHYSEIGFVWHFCFLSCSALIVAYVLALYDINRTLNISLLSFAVCVIIGSFVEVAGHDDAEREKTLGNTLPMIACSGLWIASVSYYLKKISRKRFFEYAAIFMVATFIVATRKAFAAQLAIIFFTMLAVNDIKKSSTVFKMIFACIALYLCVTLVLDYTYLGERFRSTDYADSALKRNYNPNDNWFLNLVGDRCFYYVIGWDMFLDNPINGIGINNFRYLSGTDYRFHTEYMVHICEGGIIGATLFFSFLLTCLYKLYTLWSKYKYKNEALVCLGLMVYILFISLLSWMHDLPHYFVVLGIMLAFITNLENQHSPTYER